MEGSDNIKACSGSNPAGSQFDLELWMPEKFELKMVNASTLNDYELWVGITSVLSNIFVGFIVAAITYSPERNELDQVIPSSHYAQSLLWIVTIIFGAFVLLSGIIAFNKRNTMNKKAKKLNYVASVASENITT